MLKPLRRKLAVVYTLLSGIVLVLVSFVCLRTAEVQLNFAAQTAFESGVNSIIYKLRSETLLSQAWLAQSEAGMRQIIHIEEGGIPLSFKGAWTPTTDRKTLINLATSQSNASVFAQPLGSLEPVRVAFEMKGAMGERYRANVTWIPNPEQPLRVTVIKDMAVEIDSIWRQRKTVGLLVAVGLILIILSGWLYSGHAVKPAEESRRRQVEFMALASHELKAPLAIISASADALSSDGKSQFLRNIHTESAHMARLVDDLLLLSCADADTWSLQKADVEADTLLIEVYELYCPVANDRHITFTIDLPDEPLPTLNGDHERLIQVLSILLDNALTYTQEGGHVALIARTTKRHLLISIADDGPGIPHNEKDRIFDRFYRAQLSHTDRHHAGLGLPIARELTQMHGGRIWAEDNNPRGACFKLEFPISRNG